MASSADVTAHLDDVPVDLSVIAPAHNEAPNIDGLVDDVANALECCDINFELILIDDASTDRTGALLSAQTATRHWVRAFRLKDAPDRRNHGQSAAYGAGMRQARGTWIAMIDADRQNDPSDLPSMLDLLRSSGADMVQGDRSRNRCDGPVKRISGRVGWLFRRTLLGDSIRDTGCSLRVCKREVGLSLPLQFHGMHRFVPFYARMMGFRVVEMPVKHQPRTAGETKYGALNRALPALRDLLAVRWMRRRWRPLACEPIEPVGDGRS